VNDPVKQGDAWLSRVLPKLLGSPSFANNGAIFITWDEAETGDGPIGMIVLSPKAKGGGVPDHHPLHPQHDAAHGRGDLRRDPAAGRRVDSHRLLRPVLQLPICKSGRATR